MPTGQLGFFVVDTSGKITYRFKGQVFADGVTLPASLDNLFHQVNAINWTREGGGFMAQIQSVSIAGSNVSAIKQIIYPRNDADNVSMSLDVQGGPTIANLRSANLTIQRTLFDTSTKLEATVRSGVNPFTTLTKTIIDASGRSNFIQNRILSSRKIEVGITGIAMPAGVNGINVPLGFGWANSHDFFLGGVMNVTVHNNFTVQQAGFTNGLNAGGVIITNAGVAQNCDIQWLSIGQD